MDNEYEPEYPDRKIRPLVWRKSEGRCWYCGKELDPWEFHVDHFVPRSRGGSNKLENLVPSCPSCNLQKHGKHIWEWRHEIGEKNGLHLSKGQDASVIGEGMFLKIYGNHGEWLLWEIPVLFWFERDSKPPYPCVIYRHKGWQSDETFEFPTKYWKTSRILSSSS